MTAIAPQEPGLRERKRRATRRAIQLAVIELVSERGLDGTTVDEISRLADVSPRTFFNYFASKEDAVIGDLPELPEGEIVEEFVVAGPDESLLDGLARLVIRTLESEQDQELAHQRKAVLQQYPQLFAMRMARMRQVEEALGSIAARRLLADLPSLDEATAERRGRLVASVGFAAVRHAWGCWAVGEADSKLGDRISESFSEMKSLFASENV